VAAPASGEGSEPDNFDQQGSARYINGESRVTPEGGRWWRVCPKWSRPVPNPRGEEIFTTFRKPRAVKKKNNRRCQARRGPKKGQGSMNERDRAKNPSCAWDFRQKPIQSLKGKEAKWGG